MQADTTETGDSTGETSTGESDTGTSGDGDDDDGDDDDGDDEDGDDDDEDEDLCSEWQYQGYGYPGFTFFFSDQDAVTRNVHGNCTLERLSGVGPYLVGMTCEVDVNGVDPQLGVDIVLEWGGFGELQIGSEIEFTYARLTGWEFDPIVFSLRATAGTVGYEAGDLLFGGYHGEDAPNSAMLSPLTFAFGQELCIDEPEFDVYCFRNTYHELEVTYFDETTTAPLRKATVIPGEPTLGLRAEYVQSYINAWGECDDLCNSVRSGPSVRTNVLVWPE